MKNSISKNKRKIIFYIIGFFSILLTIEILSIVNDNELLFPSLSRVIMSFFNIFDTNNFNIILSSIMRLFIGITISLIISLILLFFKTMDKSYEYLFYPIVSLMKSTPTIILSLFIWIFIGGYFAPIMISCLVVTPSLYEVFSGGYENIDKSLTDDLKLYDVKPVRKYFTFVLPLITNNIIIGLLQSFGLGFKVIIMGEYICQTNHSIGQLLYNYKSDLAISDLLGWLIFILLIVLIIESTIKLMYRKLKHA